MSISISYLGSAMFLKSKLDLGLFLERGREKIWVRRMQKSLLRG
jgi:hypothetical protein